MTWMTVIVHLISGLIVGIVWFFVYRARSKDAIPDGHHRVLKFSWVLKGLALLGLGFFTALSWFGYVMNDRATSSLVFGSILVIIVMGFMVEVMCHTIRFNEVELIFFTPLQGTKVVRWDRISEVAFWSGGKEVVVIDEMGTKVRINKFLSGMEELHGFMREKLSAEILPEGFPDWMKI